MTDSEPPPSRSAGSHAEVPWAGPLVGAVVDDAAEQAEALRAAAAP